MQKQNEAEKNKDFVLAIVKPMSNEIYNDLQNIEEDEAFAEAEQIWRTLEKNPYLGQQLYDRPDLDIYLADCYKVYFYNKKYRFVYTINDDEEVIVLIIAIGKRNNLEVYKQADERINN